MSAEAAGERLILARQLNVRGPRFWRDGERLMFVNHYDAFTHDGPREATDADKAAHGEALARLEAGAAETPLAPLVTVRDPMTPASKAKGRAT
jgi:hypothetical protein